MKQGWEIKSLGEVCEIKPPKKEAKEKLAENDLVSFLPMEDLSVLEKTISATKKRPLKDVSGSYTYFANNDVLLAKITPCFENGKLGIARNLTNGIGFGSSEYIVFRSNGEIFEDYLFYFLSQKEFRLQGKKYMTGAVGHKRVSKEFIENYKIPLPPIPEQQRIVSILDEAFAAIEKAKANAEQNLKNAKALFESYLQEVFESGKWDTGALDDLCFLITKGSSPNWQGIKYVSKPGILFVTSENVGEGVMLLKERKYVEENFNLKDKKSILKKGDVLTNIVGASIGRTAIFDLDDVANINQAVCILRCNPKLISNNYLMNLLNSPFLKIILHDNEVNTARANLSLGFFKSLRIPLPSLKEQQTIVRQLDALRAETQKLEAIYQKKLTDLEELKKSILQKAFAGEIV